MGKKRRKKSKPVKLLEYYAVYTIILVTRATPLKVARIISSLMGDALYFLVPKRRRIAIDNLRHAFGHEKSEAEIRNIARQSCRSFIFTFIEIIKLRRIFSEPDVLDRLRSGTSHIDDLLNRAKEMHDRSGGCIFVTPHIGNWEVLPLASSFAGIRLSVVARPLDNEYLESLLFENRVAEGQVLIAKRNALFALQKTLQKGISVGMLPDQSTMKGVIVDFFGRKATATPVPAMLSVTFKKPIVVVACCRLPGDFQYQGIVSDPIYPGEYESEKKEIIRLTEEMTRRMETIIRQYPEQYLWIHNRWKMYRRKKPLFEK